MIYQEVRRSVEFRFDQSNLAGTSSLSIVDSAFLQGVKKIFHAAEDIKELIDPYVIFAFAGQQVSLKQTDSSFVSQQNFNSNLNVQVSSKIVYTSSHPEFNQELRLGLKVNPVDSLLRHSREKPLSYLVSVNV